MNRHPYLTSGNGDPLFSDNIHNLCERKEAMRHFVGNSKCSLPLPPLNKPSSGCFAGFLQTIDKWTAGNREKNSTNDRNILQRDKCSKKFVSGRNPFDIPYIGLTNNEGNTIISKSVRN